MSKTQASHNAQSGTAMPSAPVSPSTQSQRTHGIARVPVGGKAPNRTSAMSYGKPDKQVTSYTAEVR
jgi:hypothetical protein